MEKVIVIPITCNLRFIEFIKQILKNLDETVHLRSLEEVKSVVLLMNDLEISTQIEDINLYLKIFKNKLSEETKSLISFTPIEQSKVKENYWTKNINEAIEKIISIKEDSSSDLALHGELLLKALNNFFVRAYANGKETLVFLNRRDPVHRFVNHVLGFAREIYLDTYKNNDNTEEKIFIPEVRLV